VHRALGALLAELDRTVGPDGAIILVHGDHGTRWMDDHAGDGGLAWLRGPQLNSAFSTLLAIRRPHVPAALYTEAVPVQDFLWGLVGRDFRGPLNQHWAQYVRHRDSRSTDTLRWLSAPEMPWQRRAP